MIAGAHVCTAEEFWSAMCRPGFVRTSLHTGVVGNTVYVAPMPPERVSGFLESVLQDITRNLRLKPLKLHCTVPEDIQ